MNITLDKSSAVDGLLRVTLSEADYKPNVDKKIKEYIRKVVIKGFRKGKAPYGMIQKMYGVSILVDEVNNLVSQSISQYIEKNQLKIIGQPLPNKQKMDALDWDKQKEFSFEFQIGLVDTFKCVVSPKIKLKLYSIKVDDAAIEETIGNLQNQCGEVTYPVESGEGDYLHGELTAVSDAEKKSMVTLEIGQLKKEEQKKFTNKKKEEQITFDPDTVFKSSADKDKFFNRHSGLAPKVGMCVLTVKTISRTTAATLGQALFDKVFGKGTVQSEEEFRSKVKERVGKQYELDTSRLLGHHIQRYFVENMKVEMPNLFLRAWLQQNGDQAMSGEELEKALEAHKKMLKWDLIKGKIAHDLAITVSPEDVKERARALIGQQYGGGGNAALEEKLDAFTTHYLSDKEGENFKKLRAQMHEERLLEAIKGAITLEEKPVSLAEFRKIVERENN